MRVLTSLLVVAALCPLSACYVGNTPPTSRRADAGTAVEDASTPKPEPEKPRKTFPLHRKKWAALTAFSHVFQG